jgi:hypothetical protein
MRTLHAESRFNLSIRLAKPKNLPRPGSCVRPLRVEPLQLILRLWRELPREPAFCLALKVGLYAVVIGVNLLVYDVTAAARNTSSWYGQRGTQPRPWSTGKKVYIRHVLTHGEDDLGK